MVERPALERKYTPGPNHLSRGVDWAKVAHKPVTKIACLGSGFVGGPTSAVIAYKTGIQVTVVDLNAARIEAWNSASLPIYEPGLSNIVFTARNASLHFSTDIDKAVDEADMIFLCVNTPTKTKGIGRGSAANLGFVENATRNIAKVATTDKIVVEKSTVPWGTADTIRKILMQNAKKGVRFDVLSNPEFLAEGTAIKDLLEPDRVIIGSEWSPGGRSAAAALRSVYSAWIPADRIITMNSWSSELSKLASNAMLAQRISNVNALSAICEKTGADVDEVSHACGLDKRIGPYMLKAGPGFGGSCFQKDIYNIVYLSEGLHLREVADYWRAITMMNDYQKDRFTKRIIHRLNDNLTNKKIAVLGFAFKKNTSDTRESPAIGMASSFIAEEASVAIYDPQVNAEQILQELLNHDTGMLSKFQVDHHVTVCSTAYEACSNADAVVIVTEWDEFSNVDVKLTKIQSLGDNPTGKAIEQKVQDSSPLSKSDRLDWARVAESMRKPMLVFDGRNILDGDKLGELGFDVEAIGKKSILETSTFT